VVEKLSVMCVLSDGAASSSLANACVVSLTGVDGVIGKVSVYTTEVLRTPFWDCEKQNLSSIFLYPIYLEGLVH